MPGPYWWYVSIIISCFHNSFSSLLYIFYFSVPCSGSDALPASSCAPGYRCITHNTTGSSHCLQSCYLQNGGCSDDEVCYYERKDEECNQLLEPCFKTTCTDDPGTNNLSLLCTLIYPPFKFASFLRGFVEEIMRQLTFLCPSFVHK